MPIDRSKIIWEDEDIDRNSVIWEDKRTIPQELGRQVGLTGRHIAEGANLIADPIRSALNVIPGVNIPQDAFSNLLSKIGLPEPETSLERVVGQASQAATAAAAPIGAGGLLSRGGPVASRIGQSLFTRPGTQATAAAASGGTGQALSESGAGEITQLLGSLAAGVAAPTALSASRQAVTAPLRGLKAAADPFTKGGRERVVGGALRRLATDDERALRNLQSVDEIITGSPPTTGTSSRDFGLAAAERTLQSREPAKFAERTAQQARARIHPLDKIANASLEKVTAKRDKALDLLDVAIEKNPKVNVNPVVDKIDEILAGPDGKRKAVKTALTNIKNSLFDQDGNIETNLEQVYGARKNIGDFFEQKGLQTDDLASQFKTAKRQVMQVKKEMDKQLADVSDEFMLYLDRYAKQSGPVNQINAARKLKEATTASVQTVEGDLIITPGRWHQHFTRKRKDLEKILTKPQIGQLNKITRDLDRGNTLASIKPLGSDTVQNLSVSHIVGRAISARTQPNNPFLRTLERPLTFLYRIPDEASYEMLVDAMLDPDLAVEMMKKATPKRMDKIADILKRKLTSSAFGASIGTLE